MSASNPPFVLVDGSYYLFRTYHALPPLRNREGLHTNAIRGTLNALNKLMRTYQPTHMAVLFDTKEPTFRHELSVDYKAHRPPMDSELSEQIPYIHRMIEALGIPLIKLPGAEADDLIGTLARQVEKLGHEVIISTGDKDMAQLVSPLINLEDSFKGSRMDEAGVVEKFGVRADQMIDYLTLMGDASDGIKGIPGIGQKTAAKLLQEYETIGGILENVEKIKGRPGKNLVEFADTIPMNHQLASIVCDLPLGFEWSDLKIKDDDVEKLRELYVELEFKGDLQSLEHPNHPSNQNANQSAEAAVEPRSSTRSDYTLVVSETELDELIEQIQERGHFVIDLETTSLDWQDAQIVGFAISTAAESGFYIPVAHALEGDDQATEQLSLDLVLGKLKPLLEDATLGKIGQHLKYDAHVLTNYAVTLKGWHFDTMLASYVLNASATRHGMDDLASFYLNHKTTTFEEVAGKGAKQVTFDQVAIDTALAYAGEDADITYRLFELFDTKLKKDESNVSLLCDLELPVAQILCDMEAAGIRLNTEFLEELSARFETEMSELEKQAHEVAGEEFNLASPKQLGEVLFDKLGVPGGKKTKSGQYSTSESVLSQIEHPLVDLVLEHRSLAKLRGTYTDALVAQVHAKTGRVHTSYHQAITSTGRLSSTNPNLQNIPIRTDNGKLIRQAFVAAEGCTLLAADYSQIELRLMAHFSGDEALVAAFNDGKDIHAITASEIMDKPLDEVTADDRRKSKAVNFGLLYGMSAFGLAKQLDVDRFEAKQYIDTYFERYPGVLDYMHETRVKAHSEGFVETILGRKLYTPDVKSANRMVKQAAERAAINAPLQGSAAEIIKLAMIAVAKVLKSDFPDVTMLLQVHDELVFEAPVDQADAASKAIQTAMESVFTLSVPLLVEVGQGNNWDEAH